MPPFLVPEYQAFGCAALLRRPGGRAATDPLARMAADDELEPQPMFEIPEGEK